MISDDLAKKLSVIQTALSLLRDLVLTAVALMTVAILYFGGDAVSLNALDWGKLVGSAFLVVLGPILAFVIFKVVFEALQQLLDFPRAIFQGGPIPKGIVEWVSLNVFRMSGQEYIEYVRARQREAEEHIKAHPRYSKFLTRSMNLFGRVYSFQNRTNPYLLAILILIIAGLVFVDTFNDYIP